MTENLQYEGAIPCCGIFCGGCPKFIGNKCCGATINCEIRKCSLYKCCVEKRGLRFCYECKTFPCSRFKKFAETWLKLGQNLIENQRMLAEFGKFSLLETHNKTRT